MRLLVVVAAVLAWAAWRSFRASQRRLEAARVQAARARAAAEPGPADVEWLWRQVDEALR